MKANTFNYLRMSIALIGIALTSIAQAQIGEVVVPKNDRSCDKIIDEMAVALRSRPESLLTEVTKRIGAAPWCACPLTKTAIQTVDASRDQVGEIVYAATTVAPEQYKSIATCALEVAPDAAEEIRQALLRAFGETSDEQLRSGKGKSVAVKGIRIEQPATTFSTPARPGGFIDNIFIIPPAGVSTASVPESEEPPDDTPKDIPTDTPTDTPTDNPPEGTGSNPQGASIRIR